MDKSGSRWLLLVTVSLLLVGSALGRRHGLRPHYKYSEGIIAPLHWTVAAYTWYIAKLGLILGTLWLMLFYKAWRQKSDYIFSQSPVIYHHRSLDASDSGLLQGTASNDIQQFWKNRLEAIASKF